MEPKSEKVASGAQEGLKRGPDGIREGFSQEVAPRDFKKRLFFGPPRGSPNFSGGPKKAILGSWAQKTQRKLQHFFLMFSKSLQKVEKLIKPYKNTRKLKGSDMRKLLHLGSPGAPKTTNMEAKMAPDWKRGETGKSAEDEKFKEILQIHKKQKK